MKKLMLLVFCLILFFVSCIQIDNGKYDVKLRAVKPDDPEKEEKIVPDAEREQEIRMYIEKLSVEVKNNIKKIYNILSDEELIRTLVEEIKFREKYSDYDDWFAYFRIEQIFDFMKECGAKTIEELSISECMHDKYFKALEEGWHAPEFDDNKLLEIFGKRE